MLKNRFLPVLIIFTMLVLQSAQAVTLNELKYPKDSFYRFGTTDTPETKFDKSQQLDLSVPVFDVKPVPVKEIKSESPTYADLSIKSMAMDVSKVLDMEYNEMLEDLSLLWQGAAMTSKICNI